MVCNKNKIVVAVTGGIAAYKAADVISAFVSKGYEVKVITTDSALNFVTANVLNVISKGNYITETAGETKHIELAKWCDAFVVVPATANTIAKMVCGIADNLVLTTFLALHGKTRKYICPAMNTHMWESEQNLINVKKLSELGTGAVIIEPVEGLLACGDYGMGKLAPTKTIVDTICDELEDFPIWSFPLQDKRNLLGPTEDSFSFLDFDWKRDTEIPVKSHVGAFGVRRKHDVHKGIDLYSECNERVYAVEDGTIVDICPFTGKDANCDWWENTSAVYIKGRSGIVVYGEIQPVEKLSIGDEIIVGEYIGNVLRVLKKDNGRPACMLHLELHDSEHIHTKQWEIGKPKPEGVLDPTKYLLKSKEDYYQYVLNH
jgi:3-polyprenyl-4-hydroxybenzoate decarboxylase